jgi:uncharacterized membrane protein YeaQ/YmgE (transglycosylase-associated protein family)
MTIESLLIMLLIGAVAGWLATLLMSSWGYGLVFNIIIGILGGLVAGWLFPKLGGELGGGLGGQILSATAGAVIILAAVFALQRVGAVPRRRL